MLYPKGKTVVLTSDTGSQFKLTGVSGSITLPKNYTLLAHVTPPVPPPVPPTPPAPPVAAIGIKLEPSSGPTGTSVKVTGWGFSPGCEIQFYCNGGRVTGSYYPSDAQGGFSQDIGPIPPGWAPQDLQNYTIGATDGTHGSSEVFTVTG